MSTFSTPEALEPLVKGMAAFHAALGLDRAEPSRPRNQPNGTVDFDAAPKVPDSSHRWDPQVGESVLLRAGKQKPQQWVIA
jgi:hypothetical protein